MREATAEGVAALVPDPEELLQTLGPIAANPNYALSVIRAVLVLATLPADGSGQELSVAAKTLGLSTSTVHRYLQTWVALEVVTQESKSRRYARSRERSIS